jgi:hypothetical protein
MKEGYTKGEGKTIVSSKGHTLSLDIILAEKDIVPQYREDLILYWKDKYGVFHPVAEFWRDDVNEVVKEIFRKKKMRYAGVFIESFANLTKIKPYTLKVLVMMVGEMRRDNKVYNMTVRDIKAATGVSDRYVLYGIKELLENDYIRRKKIRNTFMYMVNPGFYFRCQMKYLFLLSNDYGQMPCESKDMYDFGNFDKNQGS